MAKRPPAIGTSHPAATDARQQLMRRVPLHCRCSWLAENGKWTLQTRRNVRTVPRFPMLSALAPHGTQRRWKAQAYRPTSCQPAANQQVSNKGRSKSNSSRHHDRHNCRTVSCSKPPRGQRISGGGGLGGVEGPRIFLQRGFQRQAARARCRGRRPHRQRGLDAAHACRSERPFDGAALANVLDHVHRCGAPRNIGARGGRPTSGARIRSKTR